MKLAAIVGFLVAGFAFAQDSTNPAKISAPAAIAKHSYFEPLIDIASIDAAPDRSLLLEPGIHALKTPDGYSLATRDGSKIQLRAGDSLISLPSPVLVRTTELGWDFGAGTSVKATKLLAGRAPQDDTDNNLKSMQEAAKKLKTKSDVNQDPKTQAAKKLRVRRLFAEDPNPTAELFNTEAIQQLTHLSPIGF